MSNEVLQKEVVKLTNKMSRRLAKLLKRKPLILEIWFSNRLTSSAGYALYPPTCRHWTGRGIICYSAILLPKFRKKALLELIAHEVSHCYTSCNEMHGPNWHRNMSMLGFEADIYFNPKKDFKKKFLKRIRP